MKKILVLTWMTMLIGSLGLADASFIKIITEKADVRIKPDVSSEIIAQLPFNTVLESTQKEGVWYLVKLPPDEKGGIVSGYIHQNFVEEIKTSQKENVPIPLSQAKEVQPVPRQPMEKPADKAEKVSGEESSAPQKKLLSGFFLKYGVIDKGWGDWLGSIGFDISLLRHFAIGLEIMPSYYNLTDDTLTLDQKGIPLNAFLNIKGGFSLGRIKPEMDFLKVYAGAGGGVGAAIIQSKIENTTTNHISKNAALHIIGGFELDAKAVGLIFEYQLIRILDSHIKPNSWVGYLILGIRF